MHVCTPARTHGRTSRKHNASAAHRICREDISIHMIKLENDTHSSISYPQRTCTIQISATKYSFLGAEANKYLFDHFG